MKKDAKMIAQLKELRKIEKQNGGVLHPKAVVMFARNPNTALHSAFDWDDTTAAQQWRMEQARRLIRVMVEIVPHKGKNIRVSAFVALRSERYHEAGYRYMPTLMTNEKGRQAVLQTALWELMAFQDKYRDLSELAEVFKAIEKALRKTGKK